MDVKFVFSAVLFFLGLGFHFGASQLGTECKTKRDCMAHQFCEFGYCHCENGYIKNVEHCFKIRHHGQECFFSAQCIDYRMACKAVADKEQGSGLKRQTCVCDKYHYWNATVKECVQANNMSDIIAAVQSNTQAEQIEQEAQQVFLGLVVAGLIVVCFILVFIFSCLIYGCCCRFRNKERFRDDDEDRRLKEINEVAIIGLPPQGTYQPIMTDLSLVRT